VTRRLSRIVAVARVGVRVVVFGGLATIGAVLVAGACKSTQNAVGPGGECFLATDCAPGLICIEQSNGARICSDDLSEVAGRPPPEAGPPGDGSDEGGEGGPLPDGEPPPTDAGQDTKPPADTGPPDTGSDA
jgi:hypothetical protein